MTEEEFDVLDELYFVQSFEYLTEESGLEEADLKEVLTSLVEKGWVKCFFEHAGRGIAGRVGVGQKIS